VEESLEELELAIRRNLDLGQAGDALGLDLKPLYCPPQYLLQVRAQNSRGEDYAEALELHVVVMDENDNAPVCLPSGPSIKIPELSPPGGL
jgi:hypothetical protein